MFDILLYIKNDNSDVSWLKVIFYSFEKLKYSENPNWVLFLHIIAEKEIKSDSAILKIHPKDLTL